MWRVYMCLDRMAKMIGVTPTDLRRAVYDGLVKVEAKLLLKYHGAPLFAADCIPEIAAAVKTSKAYLWRQKIRAAQKLRNASKKIL